MQDPIVPQTSPEVQKIIQIEQRPTQEKSAEALAAEKNALNFQQHELNIKIEHRKIEDDFLKIPIYIKFEHREEVSQILNGIVESINTSTTITPKTKVDILNQVKENYEREDINMPEKGKEVARMVYKLLKENENSIATPVEQGEHNVNSLMNAYLEDEFASNQLAEHDIEHEEDVARKNVITMQSAPVLPEDLNKAA